MSDQGFQVQERLLAALEGLTESVVAATPRVVTGVVLLALAFGLAKLVEKGLRALLEKMRFDALLARAGLDRTLERVGVRSASRLVPRVAYLLLLVLFARTAADALGLEPVSQAIGSFLGYVPHLLMAVVILLAGSVGGQLAGAAVRRAGEASGISFAGSLGGLVNALVLFVAGIMALAQLQVDTEIVRLVTVCFLAALALAFGLSLGLGTREITHHVLAGFYARKIFAIGEELEVRGERGVLRAITPTQTLLERDRRTIAFANGVFLEEVVKQEPAGRDS